MGHFGAYFRYLVHFRYWVHFQYLVNLLYTKLKFHENRTINKKLEIFGLGLGVGVIFFITYDPNCTYITYI